MDTARDSPDQPPSSAAQRVADLLRERIVKGDIPPGGRIVERKLSAELAVSRTPVREALKVLQADGLLEISMHRGAQVTAFSAREAEDLFETIGAMESLAAQRLAERMRPGVLDRLEALHVRNLDLHAAQDAAAYFDVNSEIHDIIVEEAGNTVLRDSRRRLLARARRGRYLAIMRPERWREAVEEHERLMAALRAGDAPAAGAVWMRHLSRTGTTVAELLRQKGL